MPFKSILKISHSTCLQLCSNLPVKFVISLKSSLLFSSSIVFSVYKQNVTGQLLEKQKSYECENSSVFLFVLKRSYSFYTLLLLYNLHYYSFKEYRLDFNSADTGRKLNVHKTSWTSSERLMYVQFVSCAYGGSLRTLRSSHRRCSAKNMFLKMSQENTSVGVSF